MTAINAVHKRNSNWPGVRIHTSLKKITGSIYSKHIPAEFSPSATLTQVNKHLPFGEEKSAKLFSIFSNVAKNLSLPAKGQYVGYVTDASSVSSNNADILAGLGPYGGGMHTPEEFLSIKSYGERLRLDTAFIKELLNRYITNITGSPIKAKLSQKG